MGQKAYGIKISPIRSRRQKEENIMVLIYICTGLGVAHSDRKTKDETGREVNRTQTTIQPFHRGVIIILKHVFIIFLLWHCTSHHILSAVRDDPVPNQLFVVEDIACTWYKYSIDDSEVTTLYPTNCLRPWCGII